MKCEKFFLIPLRLADFTLHNVDGQNWHISFHWFYKNMYRLVSLKRNRSRKFHVQANIDVTRLSHDYLLIPHDHCFTLGPAIHVVAGFLIAIIFAY